MSQYPTTNDLERVKNWDVITDYVGLIDFIESIWWMPDWGFKRQKDYRKLELHTGGWSGNEEIIAALEQNFIFWGCYWRKHERGGHYYFDTSAMAKECQPKVKSEVEDERII